MVRSGAASGVQRIIGFDTGGTSTDVSHYAGVRERDKETIVAAARIRAPMMRIHTVAEGGGSIREFNGNHLVVGPQSVGAVPGPARYRRGGPMSVTDCNVLLGKIQPRHFPRLFGKTGDQLIDNDIVTQRFQSLDQEAHIATGRAMSPEQLAQGFVRIAVADIGQNHNHIFGGLSEEISSELGSIFS